MTLEIDNFVVVVQYGHVENTYNIYPNKSQNRHQQAGGEWDIYIVGKRTQTGMADCWKSDGQE